MEQTNAYENNANENEQENVPTSSSGRQIVSSTVIVLFWVFAQALAQKRVQQLFLEITLSIKNSFTSVFINDNIFNTLLAIISVAVCEPKQGIVMLLIFMLNKLGMPFFFATYILVTPLCHFARIGLTSLMYTE